MVPNNELITATASVEDRFGYRLKESKPSKLSGAVGTRFIALKSGCVDSLWLHRFSRGLRRFCFWVISPAEVGL